MMTLDERLRDGLRRSAESGGLDADDVFDAVRSSHRRGVVRTGIMRQVTAIAVVLTLFAGVAVAVAWRAAPGRYRSTATVRVSAQPALEAGSPPFTLTDPLQLALATSTTHAALVASHVALGTRVDFRATQRKDVLSLAATAPTPRESSIITRSWVSVFAAARRADALHGFAAARARLNRRVTQLHHELQAIDAKLMKLDPADYNGLRRFDAPNSDLPGRGSILAPPPVPENGSVYELNLAFERIQLLAELDQAAKSAASLRIAAPSFDGLTILIKERPATHIDRIPPATFPALAGWLVALLLVIVGAAVLFRRRVGNLIRG